MATKGKWVIVRDTDGRPESIRVMSWEDNHLMGDYKGCIIADLTASHGNRDHAIKEVEDNAKLMVAAKDMFEALDAVNNYFIALQNKCALTVSDERAWKLTAKALKMVTE